MSQKNTNIKRKRIDWKFTIIFLAAAAVFIFAAVNLGKIFWEYYQGEQAYEELGEYVGSFDKDDSSVEVEWERPEQFSVDFDGLRAINSDIVGWIRFENIDISYPIVQGEDNDYYLSHTFNKEEIKCGSIFMEADNAADFSDDNTFIYGHNMKDKSMFAKLNQFQDKEIYRENQSFLIYTETEIRRYEIYSCYVADITSDSFLYKFASNEQYAEWQKTVTGRSIYSTGLVPEPDQKTVTLMTCTPAGDGYRFLVHGILTEIIPTGF